MRFLRRLFRRHAALNAVPSTASNAIPNEQSRCEAIARTTKGRCQLNAGHDGEHVFPIDDEFLRALDDGELIIGRPRKAKP